jgi:spermidine synthase
MFGLGGGYIGGMLSNDYHIVSVEISEDVIRRAKEESFPLMQNCGYAVNRMQIVCADAHQPQNILKPGEGFDAMILDVPSTYEDGLLTSFHANKHLLAHGAIVVCNFWKKVNAFPESPDLELQYSEVTDDNLQYTAVYKFTGKKNFFA